MCKSMRGARVGISLSPAVMFMNSNKAAVNIQKIIKENRQSCLSVGIELKQECIMSKGPDRDIGREARMAWKKSISSLHGKRSLIRLAESMKEFGLKKNWSKGI